MTQLTPEQQDHVRKAKAAGESRIAIRFTTEQRAAWRAAVEQELAGKEQNSSHFRNLKAAAEQPGFFGDVRRAILLEKRPIQELAAQIGVDVRLFSAFRAGEAELPAAALDRLIEALGLRLMREIFR
jgi:hypothetical protein